MPMNMIGGMMICAQRRCQNKRDLILPDDVACAFSHTGFRSAVGHRLKAKRILIEMRRLFGITDVKLDVICSLQWQKIFL